MEFSMSAHGQKIRDLTTYLKELTAEFQSITEEAKLITAACKSDPLNKELNQRLADVKWRLENGKKKLDEANAELRALTAIN